MPLIVMCGMPASGKSTLCSLIVDHLTQQHPDKVSPIVITDEVKLNESHRDVLCADSGKEKQMRGWLKSQVERHIGPDKCVVLDSSNYIKGYRYELYCMSKERKTTHVVVECASSVDVCWQRNVGKPDGEDRYSRQVFDALVQRYEAPDSRNRWDSPLVVMNDGDEVDFAKIVFSLYSRAAPPPNLSTQTQPLTATNYFYELDCKTQAIVKLIQSSFESGQCEDIAIPTCNETITFDRIFSAGELARLRRQFINYTKMHPISDVNQINSMFIQFINKSSAQ